MRRRILFPFYFLVTSFAVIEACSSNDDDAPANPASSTDGGVDGDAASPGSRDAFTPDGEEPLRDASIGDASDADLVDDASATDGSSTDAAHADCLDWPSWPMPNTSPGEPNQQSFDVAPDGGTVKDRVTGLTWERGFWPQDSTEAETFDWDKARAYCDSLALEGRSWRLPTALELLSLSRPDKQRPALDPTAFPDTPQEYFFASTIELGTYKAIVSFDYGYLNFLSTSQRSGRVRCVEQTPACVDTTRFVQESSDVVLDNRTGLRWQTSDSTSKYDRDNAIAYCQGADAGGGGWRLPSYKEMFTLFDPATGNFAAPLNTKSFTTYWTATLFGGAQNGWHLSANGESNGSPVTALNVVRCVR